MTITIVPYREEFIEAVKALNARLSTGGAAFQFSESHIPDWLPRVDGRETYQEYFVAVENGSVRGGYVLKHQPFWINGQIRPLGNLQLPLSEGVVNKGYRTLGMSLLTDVVRRQPLVYGLGMGGLDNPLARMIQAMGWKAVPVPFYFRVVHPSRVLQRMTYLRTSPFRRRALDLLAVSGLGWLGITLAQAARRRTRITWHGLEVEPVAAFAGWADAVWDMCKTDYALAALRDSTTLNLLYDPSNRRFIRLKVSRRGEVVGWAVALDSCKSRHKQFGDLRVGSIVDCLGPRDQAGLVIGAVTKYLERAGVDLIVSNQSASVWRRALRRVGYWSGPSNFAFAASKALARLLEPFDLNVGRRHITRGDGEGPIHL
jgi:hypothetical protein